MPRISQRKLGSRPYKDYSEEQLKVAIDAVRKGMTLRKAAEQYGVKKTQLTDKCGRSIWEKCIAMCADLGFPLKTLDIRLIVKSYMDQHGYTEPRFKNNLPGYDWVKAFISKHKDTLIHRLCQNLSRSRARVDSEIINKYFDEVELTLNGVEPHLIINYDETNFTDDPKKTKVIVRRKSRHPNRIMDASKSSVSVMFTAVGDGSILPPYVVYKAEHLYSTWTTGGPKASRASPWVIQQCTQNNIRFVLLPPNSTGLTQPIDIAYLKPLTAKWANVLENWEQHNRRAITKDRFPSLFKKCLNELEVTSTKNVKSGFRAAGLIPVDRTKVLKCLPTNQSVTTDNVDNDSWAKFWKSSGRGKKERHSTFKRSKEKIEFASSAKSEQYSVHDSSSDERFVSSDERPSDKEDDNGVDNTKRQTQNEHQLTVNNFIDTPEMSHIETEKTNLLVNYKANIEQCNSLDTTSSNTEDYLYWPKKGKRSTEEMPYVITSSGWKHLYDRKK
ncbi:hypothetical protein ILUMI_09265 [Ignelater luminosus]|uniref:HTH psq-type domain-containing protein n=1 Tax=Ignelater luminosus TaxID=2038154 RepID=A0A8K0G9U4_IGNLU|nr:hypothetical protein ILUMI_09265 [Ignelater luminosus]